jgi:predicted DCC family thiol-disulfide oxidoreductase YuxK
VDAKAIVIYDSDCGFCRVSLALLLSWDRGGSGRRRSKHGRPSPPNWQLRWGRSAVPGALRPLPLGTEEADRLLGDLTKDERNASWHLVRADAERSSSGAGAGDGPARSSAGAALAPAMSLLPGGRIPASLFARFPRATERAYRWVADHRSALGRFVPARARRWADRVITGHGGPEPSQ